MNTAGMKRKIPFIAVILLFYYCTIAQMTINTTVYTANELVHDILISGSVNVGVVTHTGSDNGTQASIGYFTNSNTAFPFNSGIVLSTGHVIDAPGSGSYFASNSLSIGGDADLDELLSGFWTTNDSVILEFDFVPYSDTLQSRY
ncbi:MAG: choice-of-anchor L domain-containing protein [Bacteroidia bacterium]|nr:choice-of-anchor L domain-containing protein [Bacteroidia bacterium]